MPDGFLPSGDNVYSFVTKHGEIATSGNGRSGIFGMGAQSYNYGFCLRKEGTSYTEYWVSVSASSDNIFGTYSAYNIVSETYDQQNRRGYVNGVLQNTKSSSGRNGVASPGNHQYR
jgi:predicted nucleic-acid-binding Zn-ribbon protein